MRREERRNLRRTRKNHRHTFLFPSFLSFLFFFLLGWRRAETKNSRRWENMIFFVLLFWYHSLSTYLLCRNIRHYVPLPLSLSSSHSLFLPFRCFPFSRDFKLCTIKCFACSVFRMQSRSHICDYIFIKCKFFNYKERSWKWNLRLIKRDFRIQFSGSCFRDATALFEFAFNNVAYSASSAN